MEVTRSIRHAGDTFAVENANQVITIMRKSSLQTLPPELLEEICKYLSSSSLTLFDWKPAKFGLGDLSALSQVCSSVRGPVERILYRDIRVSADGWVYSDCHKRSSRGLGCLRCLLRTLKRRPVLRQYARSVYIDWYLQYRQLPSTELQWDLGAAEYINRVQLAFLLLLKYCTSLQRIFVTEFPTRIPRRKYPKGLNVTAFGTKYSRNVSQIILEIFKGLQELYISIEWGSVIEGQDSSLASANLRILHLDGFPMFSFPFITAARALERLQRLEQLHLTGCSRLPTEAFPLLPPTLRSLHFSGKGVSFNRELAAIFGDLSVGLRNCRLPIVRLETNQKLQKNPPQYLMNSLKLLKDVCDAEAITFQMDDLGGAVKPEVQIIFATRS